MIWLTARNQKLTTEEFIEKVKKVNGNNLSFEKTVYVNKRTKVVVTCYEKDENGIEHGDYEVLPSTLLNGCKCPKCSHKHIMNVGINYKPKNKLTEEQIKEKTEQFILKCKERGLAENISFDEFVYNGSLIKSKFICKEHGEFYMSPNNFLSGHSCPKCAKNSRRINLELDKKYKAVYPDGKEIIFKLIGGNPSMILLDNGESIGINNLGQYSSIEEVLENE